MSSQGHRRWRRGAAAIAVVPALALAGCGTTTVDSAKAEQLIGTALARVPGVKVKSVGCPSGVPVKAGGTFQCKLTLTRVSDNSVHTGTVTVHMLDNKGKVQINPSDYHVQ